MALLNIDTNTALMRVQQDLQYIITDYVPTYSAHFLHMIAPVPCLEKGVKLR